MGGPPPTWIVIAAEPVTNVDTTAADMLEDLDKELNGRGISLVFAELKTPIRTNIERYELTRTIDSAHFFPTLDDAMAAYQTQTGEHWIGPESHPEPTSRLTGDLDVADASTDIAP